MTLHQSPCTAAPLPRIKLPACPQCGDMLLAPLLAEHVSAQARAQSLGLRGLRPLIPQVVRGRGEARDE